MGVASAQQGYIFVHTPYPTDTENYRGNTYQDMTHLIFHAAVLPLSNARRPSHSSQLHRSLPPNNHPQSQETVTDSPHYLRRDALSIIVVLSAHTEDD
jgi:hypothetical protein